MAKCRDSIENGRWDELIELVQGIAAKSRRIVEVGKTTIENASDSGYKKALSKEVESLERGDYYYYFMFQCLLHPLLSLQPYPRC